MRLITSETAAVLNNLVGTMSHQQWWLSHRTILCSFLSYRTLQTVGLWLRIHCALTGNGFFWQAVWELSRFCLLKDVTKQYKHCEANAQCCAGKQQLIMLITKASVIISENHPVTNPNGNTSIHIYIHWHYLKSSSIDPATNPINPYQSNQSPLSHGWFLVTIPIHFEDPNLSPTDPWEPARLPVVSLVKNAGCCSYEQKLNPMDLYHLLWVVKKNMHLQNLSVREPLPLPPSLSGQWYSVGSAGFQGETSSPGTPSMGSSLPSDSKSKPSRIQRKQNQWRINLQNIQIINVVSSKKSLRSSFLFKCWGWNHNIGTSIPHVPFPITLSPCYLHLAVNCLFRGGWTGRKLNGNWLERWMLISNKKPLDMIIIYSICKVYMHTTCW